MLYMIIEHYRNGPGPVYERFRARGRLAPEGLSYINSWVTPDLQRCYQVMECGDRSLLDAWMAAVGVTLDGYGQAGKHFALLAVGCTGGKHRSVVMAEEIATRLAGAWPVVQVVHRDLGRE